VERAFKPVKRLVDSRALLLSRNYLFRHWPEKELFFFSYWLQETTYAPVSSLRGNREVEGRGECARSFC
jgi:hypothetical protein